MHRENATTSGCVMANDAFQGLAKQDHRPRLTLLRLFEASAGKHS